MIGLFDRVPVARLPLVMHMSVMVEVRGEPGERAEMGMHIVGANGKPLVQVPPGVMQVGPGGLLHQNFMFNGISFPEHGEYEVRLILGGSAVAGTTITIEPAPAGA